jgi:hypothetical protein
MGLATLSKCALLLSPKSLGGTFTDLFVMFSSDLARPIHRAHVDSGRNHEYDRKSVGGKSVLRWRLLGLIVHFNDRHSICIQETYNKIVTVPWYTTASIGYTRSW